MEEQNNLREVKEIAADHQPKRRMRLGVALVLILTSLPMLFMFQNCADKTSRSDSGSPSVNKVSFCAPFVDMSAADVFCPAAKMLYNNGITSGCELLDDGSRKFCPDTMITRTQVAVMIMRALMKENVPTVPRGGIFTDIGTLPPASQALVEEFYLQGLTSGCGANQFCPNDLVPRSSMMYFLVSAVVGVANRDSLPAAAGGVFTDVATDTQFAKFIEEAFRRGIATGFTDGSFKPTQFATRGQAAAFISRAFNLNH